MKLHSRVCATLAGLTFAFYASAALADPSGRVARLSDARGDVSYSPAGEREWYRGVINRPVVPGDQLWTAPRARAELQLGNAALRMHENTSVEVLNLDDSVAQFEVNQGSVQITVRRVYPGQVYEIATPTLAFSINEAGSYRVDVDPDDNYTTVAVWSGSGQAFGQRSSFPLRRGDAVRFYDTNLRDYQIYGLPQQDGFDRFAFGRDEQTRRSGSLRYVSDDMVGYADLDAHGSWTTVRGYGPTWFPTRVSQDWAPYRDGHWAWQEPYGWTWVDNAPWGYAPSHYGRWVSVDNRWGWLPGPRRERAVYAPALVAFIGGRNFSASVSVSGGSRGGSPIGWFPLGPSEAYVPSYTVSRQYFDRVNRTNTQIDAASLASVFLNDYSGGRGARQSRYANRQIAGAVTAVPADVFQNSRSVREASFDIAPEMTANAEIRRMAEIAPSAQAVYGGAGAANSRPDLEISDRRVLARRERMREQVPFSARQQSLQGTPGLALSSAPQAAVDTGVQVLGVQTGAVDTRLQAAPSAPGAVALIPLDRAIDADVDRQNRGRGMITESGQPAGPQSIKEIAAQRQAEHDARQQGQRGDGARQPTADQTAQDAQATQQQMEMQRQADEEARRQSADRAIKDGSAVQQRDADQLAAQQAAAAGQAEQQRLQLLKDQQEALQRSAVAAEQEAAAQSERLNREKGEQAAKADQEQQAAIARQQAEVAQQQAQVAEQQAEQQRQQAEQAQVAEQQRAAAVAQKEELQRQEAEQAQQAQMQAAQQAELQRQQAEQAQQAAEQTEKQQQGEQAQALQEQADAEKAEEDERKRVAEEALRSGGEQPQ